MWNIKACRIQVKLNLICESSSICNNWQLCCLRTPGLPGGIYFLNARLLKKFKAYDITKVSLFIMLLSMLGVTLSDLTSTYITDLIALACFWLVFLCVYPDLLMMACAHFPQYKGTAIAMFSFFKYYGWICF